MKANLYSALIVFVATVVIGSFSWRHSPSENGKILFSDQAAHIMGAMSIWHDGDLRYTESDLKRFQERFPSEPGPRGVFLKTGRNGELYFAKPFLYGLFSAPFWGAFGIKGFIVFNLVCFFLLGLIGCIVFKPLFGDIGGAFFSAAFITLSPFSAWISIPHPDLFISCLLASGVYLLLANTHGKAIIIGSIILGLVVFEKPTFVVVLPFFFMALPGMNTRNRMVCGVVVVVSWLIPTSINLFQDGNLLSYQGIRFAAHDPPFPLENGWIIPDDNQLGHIFSLSSIFRALILNLVLIPEKIFDFIFGRVTGILLYFPVVFSVLIWALWWGPKQTRLILIGFFSYLSVNWLFFPSNGYGGSGTYGSRYLLHIVPLVLLSVLNFRMPSHVRQGHQKVMCLRCFLLAALAGAAVTQHSVIPPTENLVHYPLTYLKSFPATLFPIETSLFPTIEGILPSNTYRTDDSSRNHLYNPDVLNGNDFFVKLTKGTTTSQVVFYQTNKRLPAAPIQIVSSIRSKLRVAQGKKIIWDEMIDPGRPAVIPLDSLFSGFFFYDLYRWNLRWKTLELTFENSESEREEFPGWADINFVDHNYLPIFSSFGRLIKPQDFKVAGIDFGFFWSFPEEWGRWTDGYFADLVFRLPDGPDGFLFTFMLHSYTHSSHPLQRVDAIINGNLLKTWDFRLNEGIVPKTVNLEKTDYKSGEYVRIGFRIHNPISPQDLGEGTDSRKLGVGLSGIVVEPIN